VKFKLADKRAALVDIGKHLGMFVDRTEITGKDAAPIEIIDLSNRTVEELRAIVQAGTSNS
jgi:phage terminase small subunit